MTDSRSAPSPPRRLPTAVYVLCYIAVSVALFPYYRSDINPDGVSYMSLAEKYAAGDFGHAVNGIWSPLLSWLIVPLLEAGVETLLATKIVSAAIGLACYIGVHLLLSRPSLRATPHPSLLLALIPILSYYSLRLVTPDLLFTTVFVYYLALVLDESHGHGLRAGVVCGVLGGLLYLSKSYGLPYFAFHCTAACALYRLRAATAAQKRNITVFFVAAMAVFAVIVGAWTWCLTAKYGYFTTGTAGDYNWALIAPDFPGHPMDYRGLLPPSNETAVSAWEDPTLIPMDSWSPFDSTEAFLNLLVVFGGNVVLLGYLLVKFSVFCIPILLWGYYRWFKRREPLFATPFSKLLFTFTTYPVAYLFILVNDRYLWTSYLMIALLGVYFLENLARTRALTPARRTLLQVAFSISMLVFPVQGIWIKVRNTASGDSRSQMVDRVCEQLRSADVSGNVASDRHWKLTLFACFFNGYRYYGITDMQDRPPDLRAYLDEYDIDYYLVWRDGSLPAELADLPVVGDGGTGGLRVLSLKD